MSQPSESLSYDIEHTIESLERLIVSLKRIEYANHHMDKDGDCSVNIDLKTLAKEISANITANSTYPEIMTVDQMQEYLQISRPTAYEVIKHKSFPVFRIGKSVRISKRILDQWIEEQSKTGEGYCITEATKSRT